MPLGMSKNSFFVNQVGKKLAFQQSSSFPFAEQGNEEVYYALDSEDNLLRVHHFKSTSDTGLTFTTGGEIYVALVGGGGGGGHAGIGSAGNYSNSFVWAGGGGAGGVVETTYTVSSNSSISFQIGTGGTAGVDGYRGSAGGDTTFNGLTAFGGGGGGGGRSNNFSGNNGGCGGGAATYGCCVLSVSGSQNGGSGVSGQGYGGGLATGNNGYGGGGGGAGASGNANNEAVTSNRGRGGIGKLVFGRYLGGGGGAGQEGGSIGQFGGAGGGGRGAASRTPGGNATSGVNGYGGGGGGGSFYNSGNGFVPGNGGNGGVLVAYNIEFDPIVTDGLILNLDAGNTSSYPGSGTTWYDISGNGLNGTLTNGPTYNSANKGSIVFDGSNDYVEIADDNILDISSNNITIEVTFKNDTLPSSLHGDGLLSKGSGSNNGVYELLLINRAEYGGKFALYFRCGSVGTFNPGNILLETGKIYSAGAVMDNGIMRTYVNGVFEDGSLTASGNIPTSSNPITLGTRELQKGSSSSMLDGNIYCARVYNRALSAAEIEQNFNALRARYAI